MARVVLQEILAGPGQADALNANFTALAEALELLLSRVGTSPNQMEADLDLNGHTLLNTGVSDDPNRVVSYSEMISYVQDNSSGIVVQRQETQVATSGQTLFTLTTMEYVPGTYNLAVYVDGVRKFSPEDYQETDSTSITFASGITLGADVQFVQNEFLGTVSLPSHTHTWSQVTNVPEYATRWPTYDEVTGKPATFTPATHTHPASDITSGRLADARRGVFVQASTPSSPAVGDVWLWS